MQFRIKPARTVVASLRVLMDSGLYEYFDAYRVQYDNTLGPTKGGIRYHPGVNLAEVTELARLMTLKCSLAGLPYGGAKGGITVDPARLSEPELERLTRAYVRAFSDVIGPSKDIPAPDVNTNSTIMKWFRDEWEQIVGHIDPAIVTGKPIVEGGSLGREEATGLGGAYILEALRTTLLGDVPTQSVRVAVQGFGNVGGVLASRLHEWGYTIVAVSDATAGLYNEQGLDIQALIAHTQAGKKLSAVTTETHITNAELLVLPVSVLVPAALGHQVDEINAAHIQARCILEMANGPVSPEADSILFGKKVAVIPDILANAGGVIVSYFEWYQNIHGEVWSIERVRTELQEKMLMMLGTVQARQVKDGETLRAAAYAVARERIESAVQ